MKKIEIDYKPYTLYKNHPDLKFTKSFSMFFEIGNKVIDICCIDNYVTVYKFTSWEHVEDVELAGQSYLDCAISRKLLKNYIKLDGKLYIYNEDELEAFNKIMDFIKINRDEYPEVYNELRKRIQD